MNVYLHCDECDGNGTEGYSVPDPGGLGDRWISVIDPVTGDYRRCGRCGGVGHVRCSVDHCDRSATKYLMHQAFCDECGREFAALHLSTLKEKT